MNVNGEFTVKAPREKIFHALRDARFFASCVEGVHDLNEIDPTHYTATFETRVAYMKFKFKVAVEITRIASATPRYEGLRIKMPRCFSSSITSRPRHCRVA